MLRSWTFISWVFFSTQTPLHRRKRFVAIRNEARTQQKQDDTDDVSGYSVHYLASQYLADSSLSTDVSQFDFTSTVHSAVSAAGVL